MQLVARLVAVGVLLALGAWGLRKRASMRRAVEPDHDAAVLLLTAWHMRSVRTTLRLLPAFRKLERSSCWYASGIVRSHRWLSRRSLLLTSWWEGRNAAEEWLASSAFREFDARARASRAISTVDVREREPQGAAWTYRRST
jgi:hypothetical protein